MTNHVQIVLDSIRRIVKALRISSRAAEKEFGLSGAQLFVLQKLGGGPALSLNELARHTMTHQSSVSVVVRRLVDRGLVTSVPSRKDARRIELTLSSTGRKFLRKDLDLAQGRLLAAVQGLPTAHRRQLAELLSHVAVGAGLAEQKPSLFFEDAEKGKSR